VGRNIKSKFYGKIIVLVETFAVVGIPGHGVFCFLKGILSKA
jgi:hypothetical protein